MYSVTLSNDMNYILSEMKSFFSPDCVPKSTPVTSSPIASKGLWYLRLGIEASER